MAESIGDYLAKKYNLQLEYNKPDSMYQDILEDIKHILSHDTYTDIDKCVERLKSDYRTHHTLIIAYDFDDTVYPSSTTVVNKAVQQLLRICSLLDFTMICFTARDSEDGIKLVKETLQKLNIRCDYINTDAKQIKDDMDIGSNSFHKVFYNIFLDDRAGLGDATKTLYGFLNWYCKEDLIDDEDVRLYIKDNNIF